MQEVTRVAHGGFKDMNTGNPPLPMHGRRSNGLSEDDWRQLAVAYDTWNDHIDSGEELDEDLKSFVRDIFDAYGFWDDRLDEPMLGAYRQMFMILC